MQYKFSFSQLRFLWFLTYVMRSSSSRERVSCSLVLVCTRCCDVFSLCCPVVFVCMQVPCRDLKAGGRSKGGEWLEAPNVLQDEVRSSDFVTGWWLPEDEDRDCCTGSQTSNSYLFVYLFFILGIRIMLSVKGGEMPYLILSFISKFSLNYLKCGVISGGRRWEAEF